MLNTLKEKQEYYRYTERPLRMKDAPELDRDLAKALESERLDRKYRFIWGGAVVVREEPNSVAYTLARGSHDALHAVQITMPSYEKVGAIVGATQLVAPEVRDIVMPKYIFERARQARGYFYHDALNQKVCTTRENLIPKQYIARVDYRYVDYGRLYWHLEQRNTGEDLVNAQVYNKHDKVPESDWLCAMVLKAKNGLYYEPGLEMIELLQRREHENRNLDLKKLAQERQLREWKLRLEREAQDQAKEDAEFDLFYGDVERDLKKGRRYTLPNFIPPKQRLPFQE